MKPIDGTELKKHIESTICYGCEIGHVVTPCGRCNVNDIINIINLDIASRRPTATKHTAMSGSNGYIAYTCGECGKHVGRDARYCGNCGAYFGE